MYLGLYHNRNEQKIFELLNNSLQKLGYRIVRIRIHKGKKIDKMQIMIDKIPTERNEQNINDSQTITQNTQVTVEDCAKANQYIHIAMAVHDDIIDIKKCNLEVSSTGIDKPITYKSDLNAYLGQSIKIKTWNKIYQHNRDEIGANNIVGKLNKIDENGIEAKIPCQKNICSTITINFDNIKEIYLNHNLEQILIEAKNQAKLKYKKQHRQNEVK